MILTAQENAESLKISKDIYLRILGKAVAQTQVDVKDMQAALLSVDLEKIQSISHRWKGDYDNMRITPLAMVAKQLNQEVKAGHDNEKMAAFLVAFKDVFFQLEAELANHLKV